MSPASDRENKINPFLFIFKYNKQIEAIGVFDKMKRCQICIHPYTSISYIHIHPYTC